MNDILNSRTKGSERNKSMIKVKDWVALTGFARIPHVRLLDDYHSPDPVSAVDIMRRMGKSEAVIAKAYSDATASMFTMIQNGIKILPFPSEGYPERLRGIRTPPSTLYVKGDIGLLDAPLALAIVGLREATDVGLSVAYYTAEAFTERGCVIVSGLAAGIDREAHQSSVDRKVPTLAVMGTAIDTVYPSGNTGLAQSILEYGGALISEIPARASSSGADFVRRNRIISGLSHGVCVIQSKIDGGTMHTVRFAKEQGRVLFVPKIQEDPMLVEYGGIHEVVAYFGARVFDTDQDISSLVRDMQNNR